MKTIKDSAEHHFLTFLEQVKTDPKGWAGLVVGLSRKYGHDMMIADPAKIPAQISAMADEGDKWAAMLQERSAQFDSPTLYRFADGDMMLVVRLQNDGQQDQFFDLHREMSSHFRTSVCDFINFSREGLATQKMADRKMVTSQRMRAYTAMADLNRVSSIPLRRDRRDNALILLVEDDRFTASYTTNILQKDYEIIHAKTGEDAVVAYIEHAPDAVFLDIHLPGLNGHETLEAIRKSDPSAYIIMLSVDTVKQNIVSASKNGASGFLKKPFSKDRILAVVQKCPHIKGSKLPAIGQQG